jgi:hypothetical protein
MTMKKILTVSEKATVEEVVRSVRDDAGLSIGTAMMALEIAQEILAEEHDILVSIGRLAKVKVAA